MRPVSAAFGRAVRGSHSMTVRARLVPPGQSGVDPDGTELPVTAGAVRLDATAKTRSMLDMFTVTEWPTGPGHPLAPFGGECFVERGIRYGNGTTEWVSLGYHRIDDLEQSDRTARVGPVRVWGTDRMAGIRDARLTRPRQFAAGRTVGSVVAELVSEVHPAVVIEYDDDTAGDTLDRQLVAEKDRHGFLDDLVTARGKVWFFDYRGHLVIRDAPDPAEPVERVDAGAGGVMVRMSRALSRTGVYNAVVALGEAPTTAKPVRAVAVNDDPGSPTYFHGPFGPVPRFYSSPFITNKDQARSAAAAMLSHQLGLPYMVDLEAVPNPALEVLDPIGVDYPAGTRGSLRSETHVLEALTIPLDPEGAMIATTREQTTASVGFVA